MLSNSNLKQDARSCVRPALRRLGLVAVSVLSRNVVDARGIEVVGLCGGRDLF